MNATFTAELPSRIGIIEVRAWIDHEGSEASSAYGIAFNADAETIADTRTTRYSGYCDAEIFYAELHRLIAQRWGLESADIAAAIEAQGFSCECD